MKQCSNPNCKQPVKSESEFPRDASTKDGLYPRCKDCVRERQRVWRENNLELSREVNRDSYHKNKVVAATRKFLKKALPNV